MKAKVLFLILAAVLILACDAIIPVESPIAKMNPTLIAQLTASSPRMLSIGERR